MQFDPATYTYGPRPAPNVEPFWALGEGATVVALDVPAAAPARHLRGVQVTGWAIHDPLFPRSSNPPELLDSVEARFGANPAIPLEYKGIWSDSWWLARYAAALGGSIRTRVDIAESLLAENPDWSLGVVVFNEAHQLSHEAWHGVSRDSVLADVPSAGEAGEAMRSVYGALDTAVGRLGALLSPDDFLVIFSPKGFEATCDVASTTLVPELLHRLSFGEGLLNQPSVDRWRRRGCPPVALPRGVTNLTFLRPAFRGDGASRRMSRLRRCLWVALAATLYRIAPRFADRVRDRQRQVARAAPVHSVADASSPRGGRLEYDDWHVATWYRPWWPQMRAFVLPSFSDLHLRLNLIGREGDGVVAAVDYARVCDEVERTLRACRSARTGHPLVATVDRPLADDPFRSDIDADLVVSWAEDTDALEHPDAGVVGPYPPGRSGGHHERAFALVTGPRVGSGRVSGRRLVDLPATLLDLAGVEARTHIDGTPIAFQNRGDAGRADALS